MVFDFMEQQREAAVAREKAATARQEALEAQNAELLARIDALTHQLEQLQRMLFGARSEKMPPVERVLRDVPEQTLEGEPLPEDETARQHELDRHARAKSKAERTRRRAHRKKEMPVVEIVLEVTDDDLPEGTRRDDFRPMGTASPVERIAYVPGRFVCHRYLRKTIVHRRDDSLVVTAKLPPGAVEGGHYEPSVHARIVAYRCADSTPFYRQEKQFAREGLQVVRSTLCSLFHRTAECLAPLYEHLRARVCEDAYLHADETTLPVQRTARAPRGEKRGACKRGWIWTALSSRGIVYLYAESRAGEVGQALIGDSEGTLTVDGYSGYNGVCADRRPRVACWGHTRRKFFEALSSSKEEATYALERVRELYRVEHEAAAEEILGTAAHLAKRRAKSKPIVDALFEWAEGQRSRHPPKGPLGSALGYLIRQEQALRRFLDDPLLPLDNNVAERALRIIALGRKNCLFAGHDDAAQNLAMLQSLVSTCQLHEVDPEAYVADVLVRVQLPGATVKARPI